MRWWGDAALLFWVSIEALAGAGRCRLETLFVCLITLQFAVVALHDLVNIPGWTHGAQVQVLRGPRKLWLVTAINGLFPGLAVAFAIYFWHRPKPVLVTAY